MTEASCSTQLGKKPPFKFTWTILSISEEVLKDPGTRLASTPFDALGARWRIRLLSSPSRGVNLTLELLSYGTRVTVTHTLHVGAYACPTVSDKTLETSSVKHGASGFCIPYDRIVQEIREKALHVTLQLKQSDLAMSSGRCHLGIAPRGELLTDCMKDVLSGKAGIPPDVSFVCSDGVRVEAHRFILAARSGALRASMSGNFGTSSEIKVHPDVSGATFTKLVFFCYTDEAHLLSSEEAQHLLHAANFYGVERLQSLCEDSITQTFTPENAPYAFVLAKKIGAEDLRSSTLRYIADNASLVMATEGWGYMNREVAEARDAIIAALVEGGRPTRKRQRTV
jgi:hypothetical protein